MIGEISYEGVTTIASALHSSAETIKTILDETNQKMSAINNSDTWKSNAAADLYAKYKTLSSKFEGFYTAVENYSKFLNQTVATYKAADAATSQAAQNMLAD